MEQRELPCAGQLYRHFKGMMYQIVGIAKHSETRETMVVYQALYGDYSLYVRPLVMFMSEVDHEKYPKITSTYRFTLVNKELLNTSSMPIESHPEAKLVNQDLLAFLDAKDYEEKLEVLYRIKKRIDDRLMGDIEMSLDIPVGEGGIEQRLNIVRDNLLTMAKFETRRLR